MDRFKITISDLLKYVFWGCIEIIIVLYYLDCNIYSLFYDFKDISVIQSALLLASAYLLGLFTQSVILFVFGEKLLGTDICENAEFIRHYPRYVIGNSAFPDWLYWSDSPSEVINIYREELEMSESKDSKIEFLYTNQMFKGILFVLLSFSLFNVFGRPWNCVLLFSFYGILIILSVFFSKGKRIIWSKGFSLLLPLIIFVFYLCTNKIIIGVIYASIISLFLFSAIGLARKQIRRLTIIVNSTCDQNEHFAEILSRQGIPKAYILIRTHTDRYLKETFDSILCQTYPNIKIIVLIDNKTIPSIVANIENILNDDRYKTLNILSYKAESSGPAALAFEIKNIFLNYANDDDIAIMLDSDDKFYSPSVVRQIMTRVYQTESNLCIIRFEVFGEKKLNYAKNYHNELVKRLALECNIEKDDEILLHRKPRRKYLTPLDLSKSELYHISTIGWVKCYKKSILKTYQEMLSKYSNDFVQYSKYGDFPDINALLLKESRICAVSKNSVLFRKHSDSVTTAVNIDNYNKMIPYFLKLTKKIVENNGNMMINGAKEVIVKQLIPYKFAQYYNTIRSIKHTTDSLKTYCQHQFYYNYISDFSADEVKEFIENLKNISEKDKEILNMSNECFNDLINLIEK